MKFVIAIISIAFIQSATTGEVQLDEFSRKIAGEANCDAITTEDDVNFIGYAYGYFRNSGTDSAVLWCKRKGYRNYRLLIWHTDKYKMYCTPYIDYINFPRNTSIIHDSSMPLSRFVNMDAPLINGPSNLSTSGPIILEKYDGTGAYFYCYEGSWYISQFH